MRDVDFTETIQDEAALEPIPYEDRPEPILSLLNPERVRDDKYWVKYGWIPEDSIVKYICPKCGTDRLVVYRVQSNYETRACCPACNIDDVVHSG